jgi:hypothetical protein
MYFVIFAFLVLLLQYIPYPDIPHLMRVYDLFLIFIIASRAGLTPYVYKSILCNCYTVSS